MQCRLNMFYPTIFRMKNGHVTFGPFILSPLHTDLFVCVTVVLPTVRRILCAEDFTRVCRCAAVADSYMKRSQSDVTASK